MKRFINQSYLKHFPFLNEIENIENANITVERLDENVLKRTFKSSRHDGSAGSDEENFNVSFFHKGKLYDNQVILGDEYSSNYAHSERWDEEGETLAEGIDRFVGKNGIIDNDFLVIVRDWGYSDWQERYDWNNITIYKVPKDNVLEIINTFKKSCDQQVLRNISF